MVEYLLRGPQSRSTSGRSSTRGFRGAGHPSRQRSATEAASFLHGARRAAWGAYFSRMTTTQLAAMDSAFTNIVLVEVTPRRAEYEMRRDEGGVLYSFPITFELDADGGWKLWQF
jgi:hypothetical protein